MEWKVTTSPIKGYLEVADPQGRIVAQLVPTAGAANLIAAAPELLGELKYLVEQFEEAVDWVPAYVAIADRAKAAIAKAEAR
jgi:uncharacterized membrane protein